MAVKKLRKVLLGLDRKERLLEASQDALDVLQLRLFRFDDFVREIRRVHNLHHRPHVQKRVVGHGVVIFLDKARQRWIDLPHLMPVGIVPLI